MIHSAPSKTESAPDAQAASVWIDLRNESAQLQLFGELTGVEISNRAGLNVADLDLRIVERFLSGFDDQMPDGFSLLLHVALKVGPRSAENINWFAHGINLANLGALSCTRRSRGACDPPSCRFGFDPLLFDFIHFPPKSFSPPK
jgi:hypothetical protein